MPNLLILHLYPETLRLNGETGNILALKVRAQEFGLNVRVVKLAVGEQLPNKRPDVIFLGSGTITAMKVAAKDLAEKDIQIHKWVALGTKVLAVGAGFDLISQEIELPSGEVIRGLGLTNTYHQITGTYLVGEVVLNNGLAGFINSDRNIRRADSKLELGVVTSSDESRLVGHVDGYRDGKVMASNVQGPLLPMNPKLADELIGWIFPKLAKPKSLQKFDLLAGKSRKAISIRVGR